MIKDCLLIFLPHNTMTVPESSALDSRSYCGSQVLLWQRLSLVKDLIANVIRLLHHVCWSWSKMAWLTFVVLVGLIGLFYGIFRYVST